MTEESCFDFQRELHIFLSSKLSRPALVLTLPHVHYELFALELSSQGMKFTTYLHLGLRLRICAYFCPFMHYLACSGTTVPILCMVFNDGQ